MGKYLHLFNTENAFASAYNGSDYLEPWVSYTDEDDFTPHVDYNHTFDIEVLSAMVKNRFINLETVNPCFGIYGEVPAGDDGVTYLASGSCLPYDVAPDTLSVKMHWDAETTTYYTLQNERVNQNGGTREAPTVFLVFYSATDSKRNVGIEVSWWYYPNTGHPNTGLADTFKVNIIAGDR
jgi:hypothetical protein